MCIEDEIEKYQLKLIGVEDNIMAVVLSAFENKRPIEIDYEVIDPLDFIEYSDSLEMLEGKVHTSELWFWIRA